MASGVELRTGVVVRRVQRDDLMTHEPVPWLQAFRDRVVDARIWCGDERTGCLFILQPFRTVCVAAVLFDLEPNWRVACHVILAALILLVQILSIYQG